MNLKHGHSVHGTNRNGATREYSSWQSMRDRCNNPNYRNYINYGGRGIKVCTRWDSFKAFYEDMGNRPLGMTLDRINENGPYCKGNCRWADIITQRRNQRRVKSQVTTNGRTTQQSLPGMQSRAGR